MNTGSCIKKTMAFALATVFSVGAQAMLINGDFETGDLTGWTTFTTDNGTLGNGGTVTSFDTSGAGASNAATFWVGQIAFTPGVPAGGGIFQSVTLGAGNYQLSLDIASLGGGGSNTNSSGGIFSLLFDNIVVDSVDFGSITSGTIERDVLGSVSVATAGVHEVRILVERPYLRNDSTPRQYVDNIVLSAVGTTPDPVPEPATLALFSMGIAGFGLARRKGRKAQG